MTLSASDRYTSMLRYSHNPSAPRPIDFYPLPSQVPFLLEVFCESVNISCQAVHMPAIRDTLRNSRGALSTIAPADSALVFSIFYASIAAMEDGDVEANFGAPKQELIVKYRLGLEYSLAQADFLSVPSITLVQALAIFLLLARRHDSPRYVWMMTGVVIRMAQSLGLQHDGSRFPGLSPFEIEMRRRVWWVLLMLDIRSSEDLGTDVTISQESFDTHMPLNINESDMNPETTEMPTAREGMSDTTLALVNYRWGDIQRRLLVKMNAGPGAPDLDQLAQLVGEIWTSLESGYLRYVNLSGNIIAWTLSTIARLVIAKMTLLLYSPVLSSSPAGPSSDDMRNRLFVAAIEVAEFDYALNSEHHCRQWRWIFQVSFDPTNQNEIQGQKIADFDNRDVY